MKKRPAEYVLSCEICIEIHTLQPHCNHTTTILQPHCNELQHTDSARHVSTCMHCDTLQHTATTLQPHCNHTATNCNTQEVRDMYRHLCMYMYKSSTILIQLLNHIYIYTRMSTYVYMQICIYTYTHVCIRACTPGGIGHV